MRGIKAVTKTFTMRATLSKRNIKAVEEGKTDMQLSFYRVRMSGLFYRIYEMERAGIAPNFSDAALRVMDGKTYSLKGREKSSISKTGLSGITWKIISDGNLRFLSER